jgi:zinc transporter ZupT
LKFSTGISKQHIIPSHKIESCLFGNHSQITMFSNSTMRFLEEVVEEHNDKPWGDVIAGSFIINLVTFSGVILTSAVGVFNRMRGKKGDDSAFWSMMHRIAIPSFAGGALLATVVFLLIPEAFELLESAVAEEEDHSAEVVVEGEEDHDEHEGGPQWRFGVALLSGFLFPILIGTLFPSPDASACEQCLNEGEAEEKSASSAVEAVLLESEQGEDAEEESDPEAVTRTGPPTVLVRSGSLAETMEEGCDSNECNHQHEKEHVAGDDDEAVVVKYHSQKAEEPLTKEDAAAGTFEHHKGSSINWGLAMSILLGDGFHNFTDGIFLGNAFVLCSRDLAYTIMATTIYHELAQEITDFFLLTHHCGMSTRQAMIYNFLSGFSVMFGAILVVALELSDMVTGSLLSVSAGVYIYIAATECIPRIQAAHNSAADTLTFLICFILGAVPIGLVLLNHGHCEAEH